MSFFKHGAVAAILVAFSLPSGVGAAQEENEDSVDSTDGAPTQAAGAQPTLEEIVVTGSRLRRDTYSSIAPLQVIPGRVSREMGQIDAATILQESPVAAGTRVDITFTGQVLDSGPGHAAINLRGLGSSRSLVLINGRRASPAGVEGAPVSPDLYLIPSSVVQQYELLLDGASSVYGSDAIAGVANVILRKDFNGFEFNIHSLAPEEDNGAQNTFSAAWGRNFDRGFVGAAFDFARHESAAYDERPWTRGCDRHVEIDQKGEIRHSFLGFKELFGMKETPCKIALAGIVRDANAGFGSLYSTPGETNTTIPNLSEPYLFRIPLDLNEDGAPDVDITDYLVLGELGHGDLYPQLERHNAFAYGEYTFAGEMNITPYFEWMHNRRQHKVFGPSATMNPVVPADNPYNPCNPHGLDGVDCGLAYDSVLFHPAFAADFASIHGVTPAQLCAIPAYAGFCRGALGPSPLQPWVSIDGDRNRLSTDIIQARFVGGVGGDLPQLNIGSMENWSFDLALVFSDSSGESLLSGINEARLNHSLATSVLDPSTGSVSCGDGADGCVPINLFAPSLFGSLVDNRLATQAEWDYLYLARTFDTEYKQSLLTWFMTGELFPLPGDTALGGIGFEMRRDEIDSIPGEVARDGLIWGYFSDRGAVGRKDTREFFAELELPLAANRPGVEEFTVNLSSRYTKDELYPGSWTWSGKFAWRPNNSLLLRATAGTSYRAPNLRENFMLGQSSFRLVFDPCVVPTEAYNPLTGYDAALDNRDARVLENCRAHGVDPTSLGVETTQIYLVEVYGVGSTGLEEEKSASWTAGFSWEESFADAFDVALAATYYDIVLRDEVTKLNAQSSIIDCYGDDEGDSALCGHIAREDLGGGRFGFVEFGDEVFINQDELSTRGVDINLSFDWPTQFVGYPVGIGADLNLNRKLEFQEVFADPITGAPDREDHVGEFGFPEWEGLGVFRVDIGRWRFSWATRYIGSVAQDPRGVDEWGDIFEANQFRRSDTCLGPSRGDFRCRDVGFADPWVRHDASIFYSGGPWTAGAGVRNLRNEWPPQVDSDEVVNVLNNTPLGRGYDLGGRTFFLNFSVAMP